MNSKEDIDVLLSIVHPSNKQEEELLRSVKHTLKDLWDENERQRGTINNLSHLKSLALVNALKNDNELLREQNEKLKVETTNARRERTRWKNRCKKAKKLLESNDWKQELVSKLEDINSKINNKIDELYSIRDDLEEINNTIEWIFTEEE